MAETAAQRSTIGAAEDFARQAHDGQVRKGAAQEPYAQHLAEVAMLTRAFGGATQTVAAAWLHDTVEDCGIAPAELERRFGAAVAALAAELTDDRTLDKAARKRRQVETAPHKSDQACLIKLADKTSNLRALAMSPPAGWDRARRQAYLLWGVEVVAGLAHRPAAALETFLDAVDAAERATAWAGLSPAQAEAVEADVALREARRAEQGPEAVLAVLAERARAHGAGG